MQLNSWHFNNKDRYSSNYRPDIDGLRAIAVSMVILCHASSDFLSGGFIGVDVFFAISGYVVTRSILLSIDSGSFSFISFYGKRCKRLIPSLIIVCSFSLIYALLFNIPEFLRFTIKNIAFIFGFISNIFQENNVGYFATESKNILLLHIWSLSIEEQFYLLLPALLFFSNTKQRKYILTIAFIASLLLAEYYTYRNSGTFYFSFLARLFEFIPGVTIALIERNSQSSPMPQRPIRLIPIISLMAIVACAVYFNKDTPFPSIYTAIPIIATSTLIYSNNPNNYLYSVLSYPLLTHLGKLSYCLYLWHWPIFVILQKNGFSINQLLYIGIPITYLLALCTSLFIENPIRYKKITAKKAIYTFTALPLLISVCLIIIGKNTGNFQFLYGKKTQLINVIGRNTAWEDKRTDQCWAQVGFRINENCMLGDLASKNLGILWGDSHAYHLIDFINILGKRLDIKLMDHAFSVCPPIFKMGAASTISQNSKLCNQHNINTINSTLQDSTIRIIAISATWVTYDTAPESGQNSLGFKKGEFRIQFSQIVDILTAAGKKIIIFNDIPHLKENQIDCALKKSLPFSKEQECNYPASTLNINQINISNHLNKIAQYNKSVFVVDTFNAFCRSGTCEMNNAGLPLYKNGDYGHLNRYGSTSLFKMLLDNNPNIIKQLDRFLRERS